MLQQLLHLKEHWHQTSVAITIVRWYRVLLFSCSSAQWTRTLTVVPPFEAVRTEPVDEKRVHSFQFTVAYDWLSVQRQLLLVVVSGDKKSHSYDVA
jgi:hypothetical protein